MTLLPAKPHRERVLTFVPDWRERATWSRSALLVRLVQVVAGIAVFLLPEHHHTICDVLVVLGLLTAVVSPARNGQGLVLIGAVWSWVLGDGIHTVPPLARVLAFTLALFVLWNATTLASTSPLNCVIRPELVRHWLYRSGTALAVSAALIGLVYLVGSSTSGATTPGLQLAGVVGVLVIVAVGATLFTRMLKTGPDR